MGIRPGRCYHHLERPYTRVSRRRPRKGYVKGVPDSKIHHFEMGNSRRTDFPLVFHLILEEPRQIRHNALEAARVTVNKYLASHIVESDYFVKIRVFPHHVMRENPLATGAGADRFSTGMAKAFGKPIGKAARVMAGQKVLTVKSLAGKEAIIKEALRRTKTKLPGHYKVEKE